MKIKDRHARNSSFSRALLAGLICGIIAAVLVLIYASQYRKLTDFTGMAYIEPLLIFIAFPLFMVFAGFVFIGMVEVFKNGELLFIISVLLLTAGAIIFDSVYNRGPLMSGREGLVFGMVLITGLIAALLLPFLGTHPKLFMEEEELLESAQE
jgi:hypothetical protein